MSRAHWFLAAFTLSLTAFAVDPEQEAARAGQRSGPESSTGRLIIDEDVWLRFAEEPSHSMHEAHGHFLKQEFKAAARDLRKAAGFLHVAAQNGAKETQTALAASAHELDRLAREVDAGALKSAKTLEFAFARAEHAMAVHDHAKAGSALQHRNPARVGHYLGSAVSHVEDATRWAGHEVKKEAASTGHAVRGVAGKLVEGSGIVLDDAGKGIRWVGEEVERVGKFIEPHPTANPAGKPITRE